MALYQLADTDALTDPALISAFDGWIDAAGAATAATEHLSRDSEVVATFDGDLLFDYRSRRPILDIIDGQLTTLGWPELALRRVRLDRRDLLLLHGPEPDFRWKELGADVVDLSRRLGVTRWISLGAIPAAVPHTRPVPILATASTSGLLADDIPQGPQGLLRVPAAALSVIELAVSGSGIPAVGFYAQVPHYVGGPYSAATVALLGHVERDLGITLPLGSLPDDILAQRAALDAAVAQDDDARAYLERLEALPTTTERIPSGDELAAEIERYLRDVPRGPGGREPGEPGGEPPSPFEGR